MKLSELVLQNLIKNEEYCKQVIPFVKNEYFETEAEKHIHNSICEYVSKYVTVPTIDAIYIDLSSKTNISEHAEKEIDALLGRIKEDHPVTSQKWLFDETEKYCQERAVYNGLTASVEIFEKKKNVGEILEIFKSALSVTFDSRIGHDYFNDAKERWLYYTKPEFKIPFKLDYMNKITKGGVSKKTLNIILGGPHAGKTAHMCSLTADNLFDGKNVLYITNEMAEEEIAARIDANLFDLELDHVRTMPKDHFERKVVSIKAKTAGRLIIKEYPGATAHVGHYRALLDELKLKQDFTPDIIYIDYLNICASQRIKMGTNVNSYTYMKTVSEELRGLAVEMNIPVYTATQINRGAHGSSDPGMADISESFGVNFTADFIYAIVATEEMIPRNRVLIKQIKNRYSDMNVLNKFFLGFRRAKMQFFDLEDPEEGLIDDSDKPVADNTTYGIKNSETKENKFGDWKF